MKNEKLDLMRISSSQVYVAILFCALIFNYSFFIINY